MNTYVCVALVAIVLCVLGTLIALALERGDSEVDGHSQSRYDDDGGKP